MAVSVGVLANQAITEASGLAPSRLRDDVLWVLNDSGHDPLLFAIGTDGSDLGVVRIAGVHNRDWEDLASFRLQNRAYLLIADAGDNNADREYCELYVVEEPEITERGLPAQTVIPVIWSIRYKYADGPRDCEAVAVDAIRQRIILLSKRTVPPILYQLPLHPRTEKRILIARRLAKVPHIPRSTLHDVNEDPKLGHYGSRPTAMDISPAGSTTVVLTYKHAYLFIHRAGEKWADAFLQRPQLIKLPRLRQAEAICFGPDGKQIFVTSEKRPAPLLRIDPQLDSKD